MLHGMMTTPDIGTYDGWEKRSTMPKSAVKSFQTRKDFTALKIIKPDG